LLPVLGADFRWALRHPGGFTRIGVVNALQHPLVLCEQSGIRWLRPPSEINMKLLNLASVVTAVALLSVPPIRAAEAAEAAKAMLKDANGQDAGFPYPCSGQMRTAEVRVCRRAF
jgi:hypothetical protein